MAKMFYTLEEAAEKLGVNEDRVKELSDEGKLQQFRDRDKLMFKREQVDKVAATAKADEAERDDSEDSGLDITLADDSGVTDAATETDALDLMGDTGEEEALEPRESDQSSSGTATGISIFDTDEVDPADPTAQTQVTDAYQDQDEEELTLDSVGSGSGLLDLTRESDDTSLGAVELLEGDTEETSGGTATAPASSTGIFESAGGADSDLTEYDAADEPVVYARGGDDDPAGDGFVGGMMLGVFVTLLVALLVIASGMQGIVIGLTEMIADNWLYAVIGFAAVCIIAGVVGWMIGNSRSGSRSTV